MAAVVVGEATIGEVEAVPVADGGVVVGTTIDEGALVEVDTDLADVTHLLSFPSATCISLLPCTRKRTMQRSKTSLVRCVMTIDTSPIQDETCTIRKPSREKK